MDKHKYDKIYILLTLVIISAVAVLIWFNK